MKEMFYECYHLTSISEYQKINNNKNKIESIDTDPIDYLQKDFPNNSNSVEGESISKQRKEDNSNFYDENDNMQNNSIKESPYSLTNIDLRMMFAGCNSLTSLSDISKWNISNVNNMSYMFSGCNSLISLPDISKWNLGNVWIQCFNCLNIPS